jgi:hypothetical protein
MSSESTATEPNETGALQIEVTPEMISAGVDEIREKMFGQSLGGIVEDVFWAMWCARSN